MNFKNKLFVILTLSFLFLYNLPAYSYTEEAINTYDKGVELSKKGYFKEALDQFNKAILIDPDFVDAYYNAGALYEYINKNDKAIDLFETLLLKTPEDNEIRLKLGQLYFKKGNYNKAIAHLNKIDPDSIEYKDSKSLISKSQLKLAELRKKIEAQRLSASKTVIPGFNGPTGITKDSKGNLYIANYVSNSITKIPVVGQRIIIKRPDFINGPIGLVADAQDNIYIANYKSNQVVKMTYDGRFENVLTSVKNPYYLYLDNSGNLYVTEQGTNTLIKLKITE
ncbi:MAG: tetratricopeptide repeat protein [bacterium]